ncbi:hypothetical protein NM688_g594 [Phlebia brevispora]|uniref:Uncharacterized protein n=1 Tax=Phlebia brevispora TaxID=194682 RepID=A0ACC1TE74_9APHY|nr:hypothetical protein NM688_g594 [Phlebia brevispora]
MSAEVPGPDIITAENHLPDVAQHEPAISRKRGGSPLIEGASKKKQRIAGNKKRQGSTTIRDKKKDGKKKDGGASRRKKEPRGRFNADGGGFWHYQPHGQSATQPPQGGIPSSGYDGYFHSIPPYYPPPFPVSYGPPHPRPYSHGNFGPPVPTAYNYNNGDPSESSAEETSQRDIGSESESAYRRSDEDMESDGIQSEQDVNIIVNEEYATPRASMEPTEHEMAHAASDHRSHSEHSNDKVKHISSQLRTTEKFPFSLISSSRGIQEPAAGAVNSDQEDPGRLQDDSNERTPRASPGVAPGPSTMISTDGLRGHSADNNTVEQHQDNDPSGYRRKGKERAAALDYADPQMGLLMLDNMHTLQTKFDDQQKRQEEHNQHVVGELKELRMMGQNNVIEIRNKEVVQDLDASRSRQQQQNHQKATTPDPYKGLNATNLKYFVRLFYQKLNGIKHYSQLREKNPPFSAAERQLYEKRLPGAPVISAQSWRFDLEKGWKYCFNQAASLFFANRFLEYVNQGYFRQRHIPKEHRTTAAVQKALRSHFQSLKEIYKNLKDPKPAEERKKLSKRQAATSRRGTLLDNRKKTIVKRGYDHHAVLLSKFEPKNVSGDETDGENKSHPPRFRVVESKWMSQELKNFFAALDADYLEDYRNPHGRRATPGNPPRIRI